jgi:hypothetical protein
MSSRVVIDPDGDMLLRFHQEPPGEKTSNEKIEEKKLETLELMVSSKVLSLVSPMFKAMLNGRFKESIELAENKASSQPYTLTLPDDREAATILVRILHFNLAGIPEKPSPACMEQLAFLCDKYQCVNAMKYCGGLWLRDWLLLYDGEEPTIDDLCRLLVFAYVTDLPKEFVDITWKIFLYHKGPFLSPHTQVAILVDHPLLHKDLARKTPNDFWLSDT